MSISSARLLAHRCCIYMLLLSVASITSASTTRPTLDTTATVVDLGDKGSDPDSSLTKEKICRYNLTNSSHTLEAKSSIYQHQGFSQCEYLIQAPSSHFILLNFTDIHSKSDMPEEIGVRRQHPQQAATETTTRNTTAGISVTQSPPPPPEPTYNRTLLSSKAPHVQDGKENAPDLDLKQKGIEGLPSTAVKDSILDSIASQPSSLHITGNSSQDSSSRIQGGGNTDTHSKELSEGEYRELPDNTEELVKTSRSFKNKGSESLQGSGESEHRASSSDLSKHSYVNSGGRSRIPDHHCSLKLIIEEVSGSTRSKPLVICWQQSRQRRIPLVYQYSVPVKITYKWNAVSPSGFSLDFSFLKPEEVDCLFRCNSNGHLCLPESQLCDGYDDCPDQSDEQRNACDLAQQQHHHQDEMKPITKIGS